MRIVGELEATLAARLGIAERWQTLEDVLRWNSDLVDVIVQDEYTHDVIVRGPAPAFIVFDTT